MLNFLMVGSGFVVIKGSRGFWMGSAYLIPFIFLNVFREDVGLLWPLLVMLFSYIHLSIVIKKEGQKKLRKQHLKLVSESIQMAQELHNMNKIYGKIMADNDAKEQAHFLSELIAELEDTRIWLDKNNHLPHKKSSELLDFHKALMENVEQMEHGKNVVRELVE